jgi:hypothetical protein
MTSADVSILEASRKMKVALKKSSGKLASKKQNFEVIIQNSHVNFALQVKLCTNFGTHLIIQHLYIFNKAFKILTLTLPCRTLLLGQSQSIKGRSFLSSVTLVSTFISYLH